MDGADVRILAPALGAGVSALPVMIVQPSVLIVTKRLDRGGAEQHIATISPALRDRGIDVEVFVLERGGALEAGLAATGVPVSGVGRTTGGLAHVVRATFALATHLRKRRFDAVHFFLPEAYMLGSVAAIVARRPVRIMSRRSLGHYQRNHPYLARAERWLHRLTSVLLGNSSAVVNEIALEAGRRDKIGLIYNGVAVPASPTQAIRQNARAKLKISDSAFVIVTVANLIAYKGYRDLLEALASIATSLPKQWKLVAVGRDEGIGADLIRYVAAQGLADSIMWLGERDDVPDILAAADAFVLASHQEGFSNALIEAMAHGLPAVATAIGGNLDAVADGQTGLLVGVQSPGQLAAAILKLALDPDLRQSYGAAARARVQSLFSLKACVARYENLYRGLSRVGHDSVQSIIGTPPDQPA